MFNERGGTMKKAIFAILVVAFVLGMASMAFAATPTVIGANGASAFSYKDLMDATAKYEGAYAAFNSSVVPTWYASTVATDVYVMGAPTATNGTPAGYGPHGGYDTASNKCKVCHAVHRAEGAYFLLRADSQDDACDYCHIGGSAHSSKVVYTDNPAGTATTNGHTIGGQNQPPDSTGLMWTVDVHMATVACDNTTTIEATVPVRAYDPVKPGMYRIEPYAHSFAGHPIESGVPTWAKVGPLALRCMNCHQVHNATAQIWRPQAYSAAYGTTETVGGVDVLKFGYQLLKRYPSGSANTTGLVGLTTAMLVKVPETTLNSVNSPVASAVAVNYSNTNSFQTTYYEVGVTSSQPVWVVNEFNNTAYEAVVNNLTLSIWCGDCHNLNIGSNTEIPVELGLRSHAERTHPVPFAHGGQCYSCHQAGQDGVSLVGTVASNVGTGCNRCHYPSSSYNTYKSGTDFPHSSGTDSIKLLGNYSWTQPIYNVSYAATLTVPVAGGITANNLDAVCLRCHPGIGVYH